MTRGIGLVLAAALALAAVSAAGAGPERVNVEGVGRLPAFSHAALTDSLIFLSGTLGTRPGSTEIVAGGAEVQTRQALANMETILVGLGSDRSGIAKCTVFLASMDDYAAMNRAWIAFFGETPPARSTVAVAGLALGAALEVECIATRPMR